MHEYNSSSVSGSAFEGIKVGPPDEFDFLLLMDTKDQCRFITHERDIDNIHQYVHPELLPAYRLQVRPGETGSLTEKCVLQLLAVCLDERRVDMDVLASSVDDQLDKFADHLSDAERQRVKDDVIWLVGWIVRFGQWEKSFDGNDDVLCLSSLRVTYWFRFWLQEYLGTIKGDPGLQRAVSILNSHFV